MRTVGDANSKNRIAIAIPRHRVIGVYGPLTGFSRGLERKNGFTPMRNVISELAFR